MVPYWMNQYKEYLNDIIDNISNENLNLDELRLRLFWIKNLDVVGDSLKRIKGSPMYAGGVIPEKKILEQLSKVNKKIIISDPIEKLILMYKLKKITINDLIEKLKLEQLRLIEFNQIIVVPIHSLLSELSNQEYEKLFRSKVDQCLKELLNVEKISGLVDDDIQWNKTKYSLLLLIFGGKNDDDVKKVIQESLIYKMIHDSPEFKLKDSSLINTVRAVISGPLDSLLTGIVVEVIPIADDPSYFTAFLSYYMLCDNNKSRKIYVKTIFENYLMNYHDKWSIVQYKEIMKYLDVDYDSVFEKIKNGSINFEDTIKKYI